MAVVIGHKACGRDGCVRIGSRELHGVAAVHLCFDRIGSVENSLITTKLIWSISTWNSYFFREMIYHGVCSDDVVVSIMIAELTRLTII